MEPTSQLEIDLSAIEHNVRVMREGLREACGRPIRLCAVVKADAYSMGMVRVTKRLEASGVDMLAVFSPEEARRLAEAAVGLPILVLMPVREIARSDSLFRLFSAGQVHLTVHDRTQLAALADHADRFGLILPLHVEVDTGMGRGGCAPEAALRILQDIAAHPRLRLAGVMSHFARADRDPEFTATQSRMFDDWLKAAGDLIPSDCLVHEAAAYGVFRDAAYARDMVRIGISLFGYGAEGLHDPQRCALLGLAERLRPALRWTSRIVHLVDVPEGRSAGYGATWTAPRDSRLALIPVGYADGYPLSLTNQGAVAVLSRTGERRFVPVCGRINMDQITIDVTDLSESEREVGTPVELIGRDRDAPNHLPTVARAAGTTMHDLLARLSPRLTRVYPARTTELAPSGAAPARLASH